ncbi:MAG: tyrosine-type recombinase/integrase [Spirochaetales bacterium]|nr:tyrosine-type recombinase/integrase [Spirochaetales bacterium]
MNLKLQDIDSKNKTITVRQGKRYKDRQIVFSDTLYGILKEYYRIASLNRQN